MRSKVLIIALGAASRRAALAADMPAGDCQRSMCRSCRHQLRVRRGGSGGALAPGEAARLDTWFGASTSLWRYRLRRRAFEGGPARAQVADVAGDYGLLLTPGAPVTAGQVAAETVRVVVSRNVATVPNCPNWSSVSQPNLKNRPEQFRLQREFGAGRASRQPAGPGPWPGRRWRRRCAHRNSARQPLSHDPALGNQGSAGRKHEGK